jgi:hypothetical protein
MKTFEIILLFCLLGCSNSSNPNNQTSSVNSSKDTISVFNTIQKTEIISVLVLPPYDEIANAGISPDVQKYLEIEISKDTSLALLKFPLVKLMGVPYQMIFDRKYCKPVIEKAKTDIIVMSKLDYVSRTGSIIKDKWNLRLRIYNTNIDNQINSRVSADSLTNDELKDFLASKRDQFILEIKNNH